MKSIFPEQGERLCEGAADTQRLGEELGAALEAGDLVVLDGPLGAGKTTFTQGIARGMGVKGRVTSPTFVIAREHSSIGNGPSLCLLYTSPSPRDKRQSRMPSSA